MDLKECLNDYDPSYIYDSEELRNKKEDVILKFKELKTSNQLDLFTIKNLLDHCNIVPEIIECYLNKLKEEQSHEYTNELINYYKVLPSDICIKHGISKKPEKELFYQIIDNYINMDNEKFYLFVKYQFSQVPEEIYSIYKKEIKNIKDTKILEEKTNQFIRWDTIYNSSIDFTHIYNEEYIYYKMSNCLLRDYIEGLISIKSKKEALQILFELFKKIEPKKNEYTKYFEFVCLALLNGQINKKNKEMKKIIDCIENELQNKFFNLEEIKNFLNEKKIKFFIKNNNIEILYKNFVYKIENYQNYNINKNVINGLLFYTGKFTYKDYLNSFINFNAYINGQIYYQGILNQILIQYVKSNIAKESIEKLFSINKNNYKTLFEEVTTDKIMKYIYYLPYNSILDTERALKIFSKIIIDPTKNLYLDSISNKFLCENLGESLNKFVNIVIRKFKFEHEQHHLVTILLFYLYINNSRQINSLPKEIDENFIGVLTKDEYKAKKDNKNVFKEAGYSFEFFVYGKRQVKFNLKQLLFIANEKNETLDCKSFKKKYNECEAILLDDMLQTFPKNQILSSLVNEIRKGFEEEAQLQCNYGKKAEDILGNEIISKVEDDVELISIEEFGKMDITIVDNSFNNTIYVREFIK